MMKRVMNAFINVFIIFSLLLFYSCKTYQRKVVNQLITPQTFEQTLSRDIDLVDNPLKVVSKENHILVRLLYIRQSENIQKFLNFENKQIADRSIFRNVHGIGPLDTEQVYAGPDMVFVIMTIDFRFQKGRKGYSYKVIERRKMSQYSSVYTTEKIEYVMGKITKNDLILYDKENNDYYYTAFAVTHAHNKELTGYFFNYKLYQFPYNKKYTPYLRIKTNSKEVMTGFGKSVNIVFKIPKDTKLDHLKIGEAKLSIPSN